MCSHICRDIPKAFDNDEEGAGIRGWHAGILA